MDGFGCFTLEPRLDVLPSIGERSGQFQNRPPAASVGREHAVSTEELPGMWRQRAELFRRHGAEPQARTCEELASELESVLHGAGLELLTLARAASVSGYSADYLGRMIREGRLASYGRKNAPRVRRCDLPLKPGHTPVTRHDSCSRDVLQIVRSVADLS